MENKDTILFQEPVSLEPVDSISLDEKRLKLAELLSLGRTVKVIAGTLDVSESWVRLHKKDPEVITAVRELQNEAIQTAKLCIQSASVKAANKMDKLIDSSDEKIAMAASIDTLNRLGLKAADRKEETININYSQMSPEQLKKEIEERIKALRGDD
jgi:predicted RND superfamily exporter protein